jgi:hypothetical protein
MMNQSMNQSRKIEITTYPSETGNHHGGGDRANISPVFYVVADTDRYH